MEEVDSKCTSCGYLFSVLLENRSKPSFCEHLQKTVQEINRNTSVCYTCDLRDFGVLFGENVCEGCYRFQCSTCFLLMKTCRRCRNSSDYVTTLCSLCTMCAQCTEILSESQ